VSLAFIGDQPFLSNCLVLDRGHCRLLCADYITEPLFGEQMALHQLLTDSRSTCTNTWTISRVGTVADQWTRWVLKATLEAKNLTCRRRNEGGSFLLQTYATSPLLDSLHKVFASQETIAAF